MGNTRCKALVAVAGSGRLEIRDIPVPRTEVDEVLVRMLRVGITRRDRMALEPSRLTPPDGCDHLVVGHIAVGRVVEVGPLVKELAPGDLVVPTIRRDCNHCIDARSDLCPYPERVLDSGLSGAHGFAREFMVAKPRHLVKVPDDLEELAPLLTPLSVVEKAHRDMLDIRHRFNFYCYHDNTAPSPHTLVSGMGPVGIMAVYLLSLYNQRLTVFCRRDSDDQRAKVLAPLDVEYINTSRVPLERLDRAGYRFRLIFETTGDPAYAISIMPFMDSNAVMALLGGAGSSLRMEVDLGQLMQRMVAGNQVLFGSIKSGRDAFQSSVSQLEELADLYREHLAGLITQTYPLKRYSELFSLESRQSILPLLDFS